jgi:hypothetical protein
LIALVSGGLLLGIAHAAEPPALPPPTPAAEPAAQKAEPTPAAEPPAPPPLTPAAEPAVQLAEPTPAPAKDNGNGQAPAAAVAPSAAAAATHLVDSIAALQSAVNEAVAGDTITLKNGVYTAAAPITVNRPGKAGQPITIAAESVGGVEIMGTNGFQVVAPAAHVVISGFLLTHVSGTNTIDEDTSDVRFTRNTFRCTGDGAYLSVVGDDAQVDHNEFTPKTGAGAMIAVSGTGSQVARRLWIHHNYFHDLDNAGSGGAQMIRFGLSSSHGQSTGAGLLEHNLFAGCRGVSDLISNRSSGNTYRYNTFLDSPNSHLTLQLGDDCLVYGNCFRNTEGVRIYGDRHQVFSNYFQGNYIAIDLGNGGPDPEDGTPNSHGRPDNCAITFNTFVDNRTHFQMSRRTPVALGATNTTFANNIIQGGGSVVKIRGPYSGAVWSGNLLWQVAGAGDLPAEGYTQADPLLAAGPDGINRLQAGSPAIGSAVGTFPAVTVDMNGRPRPEKKAKGADEFSAEPGTARFLSATDVGPNAP